MRTSKLRTLAALVLATVLLLDSVLFRAAVKAEGINEQHTAVESALVWLRTQQQDDGGFPGFGRDPGFACDAIFAITAAGQDPAQWKTSAPAAQSLTDFLAVATPAYATSAQKAGKLIAATVAAGLNPAHFGGLDLLATLHSFASNGSFGSSATDQAWALIALAAAHQPIPPNAISTLQNLQQPNGAWEGGPGWGTDTNSTATAIQALIATGEPITSTTITMALDYYHTQQNTDAGFPYSNPNPWGTDSDANSTATAIQALIATGQNPLDATWTHAGESPLSRLLRFQSPSGAFEWQPGGGDNLLATAQAIPALLGETQPQRTMWPYMICIPMLLQNAAR